MAINPGNRIIITLREPFSKDFYGLTETERAAHNDITGYFTSIWHPGTYKDAHEGPGGIRVAHEGGSSFYPWTAIQEVDYFFVPKEERGH